MKVQDIRSFFNKPAAGSSRSTTSRSREPSVEQVVEVPSRLKKGKKSKKDDDRLNVSIENSDDHDSDREDPLPKKARKKEDKNGKSSKHKSRKPVIDDVDDEEDDSDKEDPLPRSSRQKKEDTKSQDKKRKARVLSDSDDDDDFKPAKQSQKPKSVEKPAAKQLKVDRSAEKKKEELKPINPADFFSSAPVKRETRVKKEVEPPKPEPKEIKKSPAKVESAAAASTSSKAQKSQNDTHKHKEESSPQKLRTSMIEPKKLKMETPTPEKRDRSHSKPSKSESTTEKKVEPQEKTPEKKVEAQKKTPEKKVDTRKKTPEKIEPTFKAPTPVTTEKSKSRTNRNAAAASSSSSNKRSITTDDDDDEDDFNPRKKSTASKSAKSKLEKSDKSQDKTPAGTDEEDEAPKPAVSTPKQNYMKYLAKMSMKPKNLGSKNIPVGAPNCLQGLTFVISGVLDSLERDDCKDLCVKYGGRVTGSVSGKTSYLIVGDEPGESKVKKAVQMKVPQIDEDGLLEMIRKSNPSGNSQDSGLEYSEDVMSVDDGNESAYDAEKSLFSSPASTKADKGSRNSSPKKLGVSKLAKEDSPKKIKAEKSPEKREAKKEVEKIKADPVEIKVDNEQPTSSRAAAAPAKPLVPADAGLMWVDKYKPKTLKNVVGQGLETSNARKLVRWLQNWFKYHGSSQDKPKASWPGLKDPEGKTFKAALLSGPPGIGKTTSAHLAVKEVGYDYFELNASDTRNKRGLHENVADALSSKSLVFNKGNEELARKHVLIMDEVDGMSGNEDRGGVQELIALIKSSRVPLICICNDRNHPKIRSLASYCFDLRFNKPSFEQLKGFISSICFREKIKIPQEKVQQLIISTDNDVRQILHQLELFKDGKTDQAYNPKKDLRFGPWDVIRKVFLKSEHDKMSIHDKNGLFFQDYNIGPLFVQENYLKWTPAKAGGNRYKHMDLLGKTASSLADGDMVESVIRRSQNWGLLPVQAVFASYIPGEYMESNAMGNVEFPQWLGKNSNKTKRQRLLQSLHTHLHLHVSGSLEALNMDYLPYLRRSITKPLVQGEHEEAAKVMENYTLLREDVDSITDLSLWPGSKDPMERVDTKTKTAFTRLVNKEVLPYSNAKPVKGKGRGGGGQEEDLEALMEEGEGEVVEEEEDDSVEKDAMVKMRTRKAGSSKASSSSAGKGKGRGKKAKDYDDDDDDEDVKSSKTSKSSKQSSSSRSRKGK